MMKVGYLDCHSGISGDMTLGALVDAGADLGAIHESLESLKLPGLALKAEKVISHGIVGTRVHVQVDEHHHHHRTVSEVLKVVEKADLSDFVLTHVRGAFQALADAEGKVHGKDPALIHFHEVGANDAIVDVVGSCIAIEQLGLEVLACSKVMTGRGTLSCAHGILPVPGPATAVLLEGFEIEGGETEAELVTPTGACLLKEFCGRSAPMPPMRLLRAGYGIGERVLKGRPNALRILVGEAEPHHIIFWGKDSTPSRTEHIVVLETDIDDMNPEWYGLLMEELLAGGALDVTLTPLQMKKNRPGTRLTVLSPVGRETELSRLLLAETTSIGVRMTHVSRLTLHRRIVSVETPWGPLRGKLVWGHGMPPRWSPEFEDAKTIHQREGIPMRDIYRTALEAASTLERQTLEDQTIHSGASTEIG